MFIKSPNAGVEFKGSDEVVKENNYRDTSSGELRAFRRPRVGHSKLAY